MKRKYIRQNKNSFSIVRANRTYAKLDDLDDALFLRDLLVENEWNLDSINQTYEYDGQYIVLAVIDDRIHVLLKSKEKSGDKTCKAKTIVIIVPTVRLVPPSGKIKYKILNKIQSAIILENHVIFYLFSMKEFLCFAQ